MTSILFKELKDAELKSISKLIKSPEFKDYKKLIGSITDQQQKLILNRRGVDESLHREMYSQGLQRGSYDMLLKFFYLDELIQSELEARLKATKRDKKNTSVS